VRIDGVGNRVGEVRLRFLTQIPNEIEINPATKIAISSSSPKSEFRLERVRSLPATYMSTTIAKVSPKARNE
jgi:hypothetical protein